MGNTMHYELHLGYPPTVNTYYKKSRYGTRISLKGQKYRAAVLQDVEEQFGNADTIDTPILVEVVLYPPDKRKRDIDNCMKALLDALTEAGVWEDDSLVAQLQIYRGERLYNGMTSVYIHDAGPLLKAGQAPP